MIVVKTPDEFRRRLPEAEVVFGNLRGRFPRRRQREWVQTGAAGVESLDREFMTSPIALTNMARTFAPASPKPRWGCCCASRAASPRTTCRSSPGADEPVGTAKSADHVELVGQTMGIVGMGGIGSTLARRAHFGFDMRVVATDAKPIPKPDYVDELHDPSWFMKMVPQVDVLVAAAPQTPQTERMFNEKVFRSMKKTAYFLALSRGKLFDDMALVKALKEGWIAGAGLDVFPEEPPPSTHPIFDCKNVVMTAAHVGLESGPAGAADRCVRRQCAAVHERAPLMNVVDKKAGY